MVVILDIDHLRLITEGDTALEAELFALFEQTATRCFNKLSEACENEQCNEWNIAAHELKGACSNMGLFSLRDTCTNALGCVKPDRPDMLEKIREELAQAHQAIEQLKNVSASAA